MTDLARAARAEARHLDHRSVDLAIHQTDEGLVRSDGDSVGMCRRCDGSQQRCDHYRDEGLLPVHRDLREGGV
jgi:hypothetical protein